MSVFNSALSRPGTKLSQLATPIDLEDNTKALGEEVNVDGVNTPDEESPPQPGVTRTFTKGSTLRQQLAQRKYRKYQRERYGDDDVDEEATSSSPTTPSTPTDSLQLKGAKTDISFGSSLARDNTKSQKDGKVRRGRDKAQGLFRSRTKILKKKEGAEEIEMLYENQRGSFFFGLPLYSSASLLNFDPPAWTTADGAPSPVDISNAQLPDPNWEWSWRTWYVDMSHDVDEQGWQYSFMFQKRFPWHGSHPWLYSFVRRRRWIRKRVRKHRHLADANEGARTLKEAHKLNADYFTIHSARDRSPDSSYAESTLAGTSLENADRSNDEDEESEEIETMAELFKRLKKAKVDREKVNYVLQFIESGGQQVHYLADEMEHIMSTFLYQYTRKQLLIRMSRKIEAASKHREEHKERGQEEYKNEKQKIDSLLHAIKAADQQIQKLEYWSDIKEMVREGQSFTATSEEEGWDHGWQGLDASGPGELSEPLEKPEKAMHDSPSKRELSEEAKDPDSRTRDKGKARAVDS